MHEWGYECERKEGRQRHWGLKYVVLVVRLNVVFISIRIDVFYFSTGNYTSAPKLRVLFKALLCSVGQSVFLGGLVP